MNRVDRLKHRIDPEQKNTLEFTARLAKLKKEGKLTYSIVIIDDRNSALVIAEDIEWENADLDLIALEKLSRYWASCQDLVRLREMLMGAGDFPELYCKAEDLNDREARYNSYQWSQEGVDDVSRDFHKKWAIGKHPINLCCWEFAIIWGVDHHFLNDKVIKHMASNGRTSSEIMKQVMYSKAQPYSTVKDTLTRGDVILFMNPVEAVVGHAAVVLNSRPEGDKGDRITFIIHLIRQGQGVNVTTYSRACRDCTSLFGQATVSDEFNRVFKMSQYVTIPYPPKEQYNETTKKLI